MLLFLLEHWLSNKIFYSNDRLVKKADETLSDRTDWKVEDIRNDTEAAFIVSYTTILNLKNVLYV